MSHSHKINDIAPQALDEERKEGVPVQEVEESNFEEQASSSLRETNDEGNADAPDGVDGGAETVPDSAEESAESEAEEQGTEETVEALRALQALETVLKLGSSGGEPKEPAEREIPSVLPVSA